MSGLCYVHWMYDYNSERLSQRLSGLFCSETAVLNPKPQKAWVSLTSIVISTLAGIKVPNITTRHTASFKKKKKKKARRAEMKGDITTIPSKRTHFTHTHTQTHTQKQTPLANFCHPLQLPGAFSKASLVFFFVWCGGSETAVIFCGEMDDGWNPLVSVRKSQNII